MQSFTADPQRRDLRERFQVRKLAVNVHSENCFRMECFYFPFHFSLTLQMLFLSAGAGLNADAAPKYHLQLSLCRAACAGTLSAPETTQQPRTWGFFFPISFQK